MKNLFITCSLFVFLTIFAAFVFLPKSKAQNNLLNDLLSLPAPPPPNPNFFIKVEGNSRPREFYKQENPPPDDAPIEDLLEYWGTQNSLDSVFNPTIKPSYTVSERLFAEVQKRPELTENYLDVLAEKPGFTDFVKRIYDNSLNDESKNEYEKNQLKRWLTYNSDYFSDELLQSAAEVKDEDKYVTNQEEVLALAKIDWRKALPLLNKMVNDASQPVSQTLANQAFYLHSLKEGNSIEADRYRDALMKTVENKNALPGNRDLAFDALVYGGDFSGFDDWYFSLLEDETLFDLRVGGRSFTGLTTLLLRSPPGKYKAKMIELVRSNNLNIRSMAARNLSKLLKEGDPEVVRAILPWLENPDWAKQVAGERSDLVSALSEVEIPESVPGLIALLDEKGSSDYSEDYEGDEDEDSDPDYASNTAVNADVMAANTANYNNSAEDYYYHPYRAAAINALVKQKSPQAVPALRRLLPEVESWERDTLIKAILESGGFTVGEQIDALESVADTINPDSGADLEVTNYFPPIEFGESAYNTSREMPPPPPPAGPSYKTNMLNVNMDSMMPDGATDSTDIKPVLGKMVVELSEPSAELISGIFRRIEQLENRNPNLAAVLRQVVKNWNGTAVNAILLNDLANGKADSDSTVKLLSLRKKLREKQSNDVFAARSGNNLIALGITACILENQSEYAQILASDNAELKTALFACARLIRAKLPIQKVAENLQNPNKTLAKAAELYLESEDSPEARSIVYNLYPQKAKILGATAFFAPENARFRNFELLSRLFSSVDEKLQISPYLLYGAAAEKIYLDEIRKPLQEEVIENPKILGIYAYNNNFVRIYEDKTVFSWSENEARFRERTLEKREFEQLKSYLAANDVSNLPPFVGDCYGKCNFNELLMLGADGGRRVYMKSSQMPEFFTGLNKIFEDLRKPPAKLRYHLEEELAGLEILYADDKNNVITVWKNAADFRLLIENVEIKERNYEEMRRAHEVIFDAMKENADYAKLEAESEKRRRETAYSEFSWRNLKNAKLGDFVGQPPGLEIIPPKDKLVSPQYYSQWKRRAGNIEIKAGDGEFYVLKNGQTVRTQKGNYGELILSADGRWLVTETYSQESEERNLIRINVLTGKQAVVKLKPELDIFRALAFVASTGKFLIVAGKYDSNIETFAFYLLDAETGTLQEVKGEFMPLIMQTFRDLQPNGKPDEFWAALPDEKKKFTQVGVYNTKTFTFTPKLKIPRIAFSSMDLWVDEPENKIYFVYDGQLLALPLAKK